MGIDRAQENARTRTMPRIIVDISNVRNWGSREGYRAAKTGRFPPSPVVMPGLPRHPASIPPENHQEAGPRIRSGVTVNYQSVSGRLPLRDDQAGHLTQCVSNRQQPFQKTSYFLMKAIRVCPIPRLPAYLRTALSNVRQIASSRIRARRHARVWCELRRSILQKMAESRYFSARLRSRIARNSSPGIQLGQSVVFASARPTS